MKWFGRDEDERMWVCALPVSKLWEGESDAFLESFEPENPSLLIPRKFGLGWDLNLAAIAVKAGWMRPDDSLPDLAEHIPLWMRRFLKIAPVVGSAFLSAGALNVATKEQVATSWSFTGKPQKFMSAKKAALIPVSITLMAALLPRFLGRTEPESKTALNVARQGQVLGMEIMSLGVLIASARSATLGKKRQFLGVVAPVLYPLVSGGVQLLCVKTALANLDKKLAIKNTDRKEKQQ
ncbi:hypothetical protein KRX54_00470 [Actinomycetaceae bacterium TAE3-ERU4]|nr:hypothetical protein [Actinomycetaceae bacterium TAE3-ERU4]